MSLLLKPLKNYKSQKLQVSQQTLRRWASVGKISFITTDGGHRRYYLPSSHPTASKIIYARVSSKKQSADLQRQISFLQNQFPEYEIITDIGSGINFQRPGLISILERLFQNNIQELVVAHKDRLTRFGFDLFVWIFSQFGATINVIQDQKSSPSEELSNDLLAIITVFTARLHGSRKYKIL